VLENPEFSGAYLETVRFFWNRNVNNRKLYLCLLRSCTFGETLASGWLRREKHRATADDDE
jgi:hypothetical protein